METNTISYLKAALAHARDKHRRAMLALAPKHVGGEWESYAVARQDLYTAERELARAEGRPYAIPCECPISWDIGDPAPTLLQSDHNALLFFRLVNDDHHVGRIVFKGLSSSSLGAPNDETFAGHPLFGSGFEHSCAMQVINSSWVAQLIRMNSVHPRHNPSFYSSKKHFVFPFHDTTFECIAESFTTAKVPLRLPEALRDAVSLLPIE